MLITFMFYIKKKLSEIIDMDQENSKRSALQDEKVIHDRI